MLKYNDSFCFHDDSVLAVLKLSSFEEKKMLSAIANIQRLVFKNEKFKTLLILFTFQHHILLCFHVGSDCSELTSLRKP